MIFPAFHRLPSPLPQNTEAVPVSHATTDAKSSFFHSSVCENKKEPLISFEISGSHTHGLIRLL
jgi:hypothetical protein